jgi:hypothetical protein
LHPLAVQARQADDKVNHISVGAQLQARKFAQAAASVPSGGWYFEWVGYDAGRSALGGEHPAWLPPTAMVLRAAFETLEVRVVTMVLLSTCQRGAADCMCKLYKIWCVSAAG